MDLRFAVEKGGSVVVSAALIGAAIGSLAAGQFADRIGPGKALLWNNVLLLVGSLLCAVSPGGIWAAVIGKSACPTMFWQSQRACNVVGVN